MSNDRAAQTSIRVAILTASDSVAQGRAKDVSGPVLKELVEAEGMQVVQTSILPDEQEQIAAWLRRTADAADVLLTCGGTGLGPRDVMPEATQEVIDYQVPGIAEALRAAGLEYTPYAMLSRAVAGVIANTLVVNLPGSPTAVRQQFEVLRSVLPHAVALLRGDTTHDDDERKPVNKC